MDIILDSSFFHALLQTTSTETDNYRDFEHFIKQLKNFHLFVQCATKDDFYRLVKEDPYLELLINSSPIKLINSDSLLEDIKLREFYEGGSCFKLFFLSESAENCSILSKQFGYEYISPDNFEQKWTTYNSSREDTIRKVTTRSSLPAEYRFDSWDCLDIYSHPVNSILINDSYILNDQPNKKIRDNLLPLLKKLTEMASELLPLDIIIFADPNPNRLDYKKIHAILSEELDRFLGRTRYQLHLIKYSAHDRFVLTNYFYIKCGRGFTIFREDGLLHSQSTTTIEFQFVFSSREKAIVFDTLEDLKEIIAKLENSGPNAAYEVINYYPDKGNRLLNAMKPTD